MITSKDFEVLDYLGQKWAHSIMAEMNLEHCNELYDNYHRAHLYVWAHCKKHNPQALKCYDFEGPVFDSLNESDADLILAQNDYKDIILKTYSEMGGSNV